MPNYNKWLEWCSFYTIVTIDLTVPIWWAAFNQFYRYPKRGKL